MTITRNHQQTRVVIAEFAATGQGLASRLMKMFARWQRIGTAINYLCRDTAKLF